MEVCRSSKSREACKASTKNPQSMQSIHSNHGLEFRSQYEVNDNVVSLWMFCGYYPFLLKIDLCDRKRKHFTELNRCQVDLFPDTSLLYQHTTEAVVHKYRYMIFFNLYMCMYIYIYRHEFRCQIHWFFQVSLIVTPCNSPSFRIGR